MAKDTDDRRQVDRDARGDRAIPRDHLPPGGRGDAPTEPPEAVVPADDVTGGPQRTHGEAWDAVRPHNEGSEQGPR